MAGIRRLGPLGIRPQLVGSAAVSPDCAAPNLSVKESAPQTSLLRVGASAALSREPTLRRAALAQMPNLAGNTARRLAHRTVAAQEIGRTEVGAENRRAPPVGGGVAATQARVYAATPYCSAAAGASRAKPSVADRLRRRPAEALQRARANGPDRDVDRSAVGIGNPLRPDGVARRIALARDDVDRRDDVDAIGQLEAAA